MYSVWQSFKQVLLVDSPLLSYIDIQYNFLPPKLTTGEARKFGKRYTCSDKLALLRDESAERVSWCLRELAHEAIQQEALVQEQAQPENPVVEPEHLALEATVMSTADTNPGENMVARKVMTIDRFVPGARQPSQPPPSQGRGQVPPPPPPSQARRAQKKQRVANQPSTGPGDSAVQTPPRPTGGIVIHEPQTQVDPGVASSSQITPAWKPKFLLDGKPLPSTACVQMWEKGEGCRIAQTLAEGLLLLDDVHAFEEGLEESVGRRLEWHAIVVTPCLSFTFHTFLFTSVLTSVFVRLLNWLTYWLAVKGILPRKLIVKRERRSQLPK